jgi:hypothetical protein
MKTFRSDIEYFHKKLKSGENFSLSKFADGEWAVIKNTSINNKEFWFDPHDSIDQKKRKALIDAFKFKHKNYYVGISCPCCQGQEVFTEMLQFSEQNEENLTWANIWVNSNYRYYIQNILPIYSQRQTILFCNHRAMVENLPFIPYAVFKLQDNSWQHDWDTIDLTKRMIDKENIKDAIFLFCCGPFGNILCHELTNHNDENTYLDIGSTLNPLLKSAGFERHYYMGNNIFSNLECRWGK